MHSRRREREEEEGRESTQFLAQPQSVKLILPTVTFN